MDPILEQALRPVLRDIRQTGAPMPRMVGDPSRTYPDYPSAMLWSQDGTGSGVNVYLPDPEPNRIARVADHVQEWVIEARWTKGSNWPPCPRHPSTHPLQAQSRAGLAVWVCPKDGAVISEIGSL